MGTAQDPPACVPTRHTQPETGDTVSTLALLVLLLLVLVVLLFLGGLVYVTYRHPRFATPLMVAGTFGAALVGVVAIIATL